MYNKYPLAFYTDYPPFNEIIKPITNASVPGIVPGYFISNYGRVFSGNYQLKPVPTYNFYLRVFLYTDDGTGRYYLIHRIEMIEFNPISNYDNLEVNHKDGNKFDNRICNLEWATSSENIQHAYNTGLKTVKHCGESPNALITNDQAELIAQLVCSQKYTMKQIAEQVGCDVSFVWRIVQGVEWKDIHDRYNLSRFKRESRPGFSDEDLHKLCKYFEDNKNRYNTKSELYRHALMDLFNMEYNQYLSASMSRIFNHQTRKDITNQYDF